MKKKKLLLNRSVFLRGYTVVYLVYLFNPPAFWTIWFISLVNVLAIFTPTTLHNYISVTLRYQDSPSLGTTVMVECHFPSLVRDHELVICRRDIIEIMLTTIKNHYTTKLVRVWCIIRYNPYRYSATDLAGAIYDITLNIWPLIGSMLNAMYSRIVGESLWSS